MKTKIKILPGILVAFLFGSVLAQAIADPRYFYGESLRSADQEYGYCLRASRHGGACLRQRGREQERCWSTFQSLSDGNRYNYFQPYDDGRFHPIPIPQRPVYILPGAR